MSIQMPRSATHSIHSSTLADVLERVLDKGLVIAGDIKVKLVDIELLTIQIRLVVASVDKAREMGLDWWTTNPDFCPDLVSPKAEGELAELKQRLAKLEARASEATQKFGSPVMAPAIASS
jgi:Gas vesicle protein